MFNDFGNTDYSTLEKALLSKGYTEEKNNDHRF